MTKETSRKLRKFGDSLVACAKVIEIGEDKMKSGEVNLGSKIQSFASAGFGLETYFMRFNESLREAIKQGFPIKKTINTAMDIFNEKVDYFKEISNEINRTPLRDDLLEYFPQELNYIAQRN